jgi:hypothetical protein
MLDVSGSMLGQRFEIAKQTIEVIMETLSENDQFNIMTVRKFVVRIDELDKTFPLDHSRYICLQFANEPNFFEDCLNDTLIQATTRNKKANNLIQCNYFSIN